MKSLFKLCIFFSSIWLSSIVHAQDKVRLPVKGIEVVSIKNMSLPTQIKNNIMAIKHEVKKKGYHETNSKYALFLLGIEQHAVREIQMFKANPNPTDSHLKSQITDINLAFSFQLPSFIEERQVLGYAPLGMFDSVKGWSGIKLFFKEGSKNICAFSLFDLGASKGAVQINKETMETIVNNKPSSSLIQGNNNSGYVYNVTWFDPTVMYQVDCAYSIYDPSFLSEVIILARQFDFSLINS